MTLVKIAWFNVWRNKSRSMVIFTALALGIWGGAYAMALMKGMVNNSARQILETQISHIQVQDSMYLQDYEARYVLSGSENIIEYLDNASAVESFSPRLKVIGMASSATSTSGLFILGVDTGREAQTTKLRTLVVEGEYFKGVSRNPVLVGRSLAEKLKVDVGSKLILTFQDSAGTIISGSFKICGLFESISTQYDEGMIFTRKEDLGDLLGIKGYHEIAIFLNKVEKADYLDDTLAGAFPDVTVRNWREIAPELNFMQSQVDTSSYIFIGIILFALMFGIINTMLMAVLERTREFGVLKAIGMNRPKIFMMVSLETVFLSLVGLPFGLFLAWGTIHITAQTGIDLTLYSKGLASFGYGSVIYPELPLYNYIQIAVLVGITGIISSIYPAIRALRLQPATAIRTKA